MGEPARLLASAHAAMAAVAAGDGSRDVALDLLAADALFTLALLHVAEHDPVALGRVAGQMSLGPVES